MRKKREKAEPRVNPDHFIDTLLRAYFYDVRRDKAKADYYQRMLKKLSGK